MNGAYAIPTNQVFVTRKEVLTKKALSPEAKAIRDFYESHNFSIKVNPLTGGGIVEATPLNKE